MMNLSTLIFLVNTEAGPDDYEKSLEELSLMNDNAEPVIEAPEAAVMNILGFASAYVRLPSAFLDEIELLKN
jgi:hypothetical protein